MIKLVFRSMFNQKLPFFLFLLGLVLIFSTFPVVIVSLKDAMVQIEDDITKHARGSYDILVRPDGSRSVLEKELGIVEENYLSSGNGGITINEWKKIQQISGIEVAAPVASLGYFTGESRTFSTWMPTQSVRVRSELFTTDGIHTYPIDPELDSVGFMLEQDSEPNIIPEYDFLSKNNAEFMQWDPPAFWLPLTFHIMTGIDPEEEEKLTGIAFDEIKDNQNYDKSTFAFAKGAPVIPVMKLSDPKVPIETVITWEELNIEKEQTAAWKQELGVDKDGLLMFGDRKKYDDLFERLLQYPALSKDKYKIDFKEVIKPFEYHSFMVEKDLSIKENENMYMGHLGSTSKFYSAQPVNYIIDKKNSALSVKQVGNFHGVPTYRSIEEKGGTFNELNQLPFVLNPNGEYTVKETEKTLSASPLGIYQLAPIMLIRDENGNDLEKPIELYSTIFPGSFVPSPAHGVINITDSEIIKGDKPIDAIRVRVASISDYNEEAIENIEFIAKQLLEMGYEVDIVAGASYQNTEVLVEGLGTVIQPWTTLGAAATIVNGWSGTTILLSLFFVLTAIIYIWNRLYFFRQRKTDEIRLLLNFGWEVRKVKRLLRIELVLIVLFSWGLSLLSLFFLHKYTSNSNLGSLLLWNILFANIFLIFMIGTTELSWRKLLTIKQFQNTKIKQVKQAINPSSSLFLAIKSIQFYRKFIFSTFIQVIIVSALTVFVFLALHSTVELTNTTMLGEYVNFQINSFHLFILGSSCVIGIITLIEALSSLFILRKNEISIFRSIGWKHRKIFTYWFREIAVWTSITVIIGHIIGFIVYLNYYPFVMQSLQTIFVSLVIIFLVILMISSAVLQLFLNSNKILTFLKGKTNRRNKVKHHNAA
jgi:putative ABC transport system permease protein